MKKDTVFCEAIDASVKSSANASDVEIFVSAPKKAGISVRCQTEDTGTNFIIPGSETVVKIHSIDNIPSDGSVIAVSIDIPHSSNRETVEFLLNMQ